jgi:acyl carrier protein
MSRLLELKEVAYDDNFFLLGGHSLLGAQVLAQVRETFGVTLTLRQLFEAPTVSQLAAEIERAELLASDSK